MIDIERIATMAQGRHDVGMHVGDFYDVSCPTCNPDYYRQDTATNMAEDKRITERLRTEYPGYLWPGTEPIEAEDDDEDRIAGDHAHGTRLDLYADTCPQCADIAEDRQREEWSEYLEWQRGMME
jgi:hypothetical protein